MEYSGDLNRNLISDSLEHRTVWVTSIQLVKSGDLKDHSNTRHFGPQTGFSSQVFRPPSKYLTILQPDTNLPFEY